MIPIIAWVDMANAVIAGVLALRLFISYKKSHSRSIKLFFITYVFFALYMLFAAGAGLLTENPYNMVYTNTLSFAFLYLASIMVIQIPFVFMPYDNIEKIFSGIIFFAGMIGVYGIFTTSYPHEFSVITPYIYWRPVMAPWVRILTGIIILPVTIIFINIFWRLGYRSKNNATVYRRSMRLTYGMICLLIGSTLNFIVGAGTNFAAIASGTLIAGIGLIIMADGILHETRQIATDLPLEKNDPQDRNNVPPPGGSDR